MKKSIDTSTVRWYNIIRRLKRGANIGPWKLNSAKRVQSVACEVQRRLCFRCMSRWNLALVQGNLSISDRVRSIDQVNLVRVLKSNRTTRTDSSGGSRMIRSFSRVWSLAKASLKLRIWESFSRVWSWLRTNAGGVPNTCKSNEGMQSTECFV